MGQLPVCAYVCVREEHSDKEAQNQTREAANNRIKEPNREPCIVNIRGFDGLERRVVINHHSGENIHPSCPSQK